MISRTFIPASIDVTHIVVDAATVREIGGPLRWAALPTATPAFPGVTAWRGRAIAVADIAAVLGANARLAQASGRARTLFVECGTAAVAVPVDAVQAPIAISIDAIRAPRSRIEAACTGEAELDGRTVIIIDLGALLGHRSGGRRVEG